MTRYVSLCSGTLGLDMAVQAVFGHGPLVAVSDTKAAAAAWLADRFPSVPNVGDLTTATWSRDQAEIITAGWPCQPHSAAGLRLGEDDPRAIWPHVAEVIGTIRPAIFIGENVPRVATNGELRRVVRSLARLGYVGAWGVFSAAGAGAPHLRKRICVVAADPERVQLRDEPGRSGGPSGQGPGVAGDDGPERPIPLLKTPLTNLATNGGSQHPDKRKAGGHGPTLADEVEWLLPTPKRGDDKRGAVLAERVRDGRVRGIGDMDLPTVATQLLPTPQARDGKGAAPNRTGVRLDNGRTRTERDLDLPGATLLLPTPRARDGKGRTRDGQGTPGLPVAAELLEPDRWGDYAAAIARWEAVLMRRAPDPTEYSTRSKRGVLSPRFVEWMMGLPEGWVVDMPGIGRTHALSMLGDGVVPQAQERAIRSLIPHLVARLTELDAAWDVAP